MVVHHITQPWLNAGERCRVGQEAKGVGAPDEPRETWRMPPLSIGFQVACAEPLKSRARAVQ